MSTNARIAVRTSLEPRLGLDSGISQRRGGVDKMVLMLWAHRPIF